MTNSKAFRFAIWVLLVFIIIYVGTKISFIFRPIVVLFSTIFFPVFFAGILYYLTEPFVMRLQRKKVPRTLAILAVFLLFAAVVTVLVLYIGPIVQIQFLTLVDNTPRLVNQLYLLFLDFQESGFFERFEAFPTYEEWTGTDLAAKAEELARNIIESSYSILGFITNILIILATIPIILFYMLKDGHKLPRAIVRFIPEEYQEEGLTIIRQMNATLSAFIQGQLIVSVFVGTMVYIAYSIIGLEYSLLLALLAMITNVVPYFGPVIGTIPGMIVGLIQSPWTALQVLLFVLVIQQVESQIIAPQVLGRKLSLHPITIIVVLLTAGSLLGLVGMIIAVPTYAVGKVVVIHLHDLIKLRVAKQAEAERDKKVNV